MFPQGDLLIDEIVTPIANRGNSQGSKVRGAEPFHPLRQTLTTGVQESGILDDANQGEKNNGTDKRRNQ